MPDREKVIRDIERCAHHVPDACRDCSKYGGGYELRCMEHLMEDALALLREQEPRVMTLEEVKAMPYGHVLIETDKKDSLRWLDALLFSKNTNRSFDFITLEGRARLLEIEYNREWRCWTARPTDEQREAVKWGETD